MSVVNWTEIGRRRRQRKADVQVKLWGKQGGLCCYCEKPMAQKHVGGAIEAIRLSISVSEVPRRRATIEHLRRKADGGTYQWDNLALACKGCNHSRGETDWLTYKSIKLGEIPA